MNHFSFPFALKISFYARKDTHLHKHSASFIEETIQSCVEKSVHNEDDARKGQFAVRLPRLVTANTSFFYLPDFIHLLIIPHDFLSVEKLSSI